MTFNMNPHFTRMTFNVNPHFTRMTLIKISKTPRMTLPDVTLNLVNAVLFYSVVLHYALCRSIALC